MVKLFILALLLIVGGAIIGMTTDHNPALLIVAGFVCGAIAALRETDSMPTTIAAENGQASPGAEADARELTGYRFPAPAHQIGPFTCESGGGAP